MVAKMWPGCTVIVRQMALCTVDVHVFHRPSTHTHTHARARTHTHVQTAKKYHHKHVSRISPWIHHMVT